MRVIVNLLLCFAVLGCGDSKTERQARLAVETKQRQLEYIDLKVKELEIRFDKGETNAVLTSLTEMAESGCARAQGVLAAKLHSLRNFEKANYWAVKAADKGDGRGMNVLGVLHLHGQAGCQRSPAQAISWFQKSGESGCAHGYNNLGVMYRDGNGCQKSALHAFEWFKKSAELGFGPGCFETGRCYLMGDGVGCSPSEGVRWLKESVRQEVVGGRVLLGLVYANGIEGIIAKDLKQAFDYLKGVPEESLATSIPQHLLHEISSIPNAAGDKQQERRFYSALAKSSRAETPDMKWLGKFEILLMDFNMNEHDDDKRRAILRELEGLSETTNVWAKGEICCSVGVILATVKPFVDKQKAAAWLEKSAMTGLKKGITNLIEFRKSYIEDFPVFMKNEPLGIATENSVNFCVGHGLLRGIGFEKNEEMAVNWLVGAARRGSVDAYIDLYDVWDRRANGRNVGGDWNKYVCMTNGDFCLRQAALLSGSSPDGYRVNLTAQITSADERSKRTLTRIFGNTFDTKYLVPRIREYESGVKEVEDSSILPGRDSETVPIEQLYVKQSDLGSEHGDANCLLSIFGVELGGVIKKNIKPSGTSADGFPIYRFKPKKQFREFEEYWINATPISRKIFKISASEISSRRREYSTVLAILESKYERKAVEMLGYKCIVFPHANRLFRKGSERFIRVSGSDQDVTVQIDAFDGSLCELGKDELTKSVLQESASDMDAL